VPRSMCLLSRVPAFTLFRDVLARLDHATNGVPVVAGRSLLNSFMPSLSATSLSFFDGSRSTGKSMLNRTRSATTDPSPRGGTMSGKPLTHSTSRVARMAQWLIGPIGGDQENAGRKGSPPPSPPSSRSQDVAAMDGVEAVEELGLNSDSEAGEEPQTPPPSQRRVRAQSADSPCATELKTPALGRAGQEDGDGKKEEEAASAAGSKWGLLRVVFGEGPTGFSYGPGEADGATAKRLLAAQAEAVQGNPQSTNGRTRAVSADCPDKRQFEFLGAKSIRGAVVTHVSSNGQAHLCGVEPGDWVFEVDDVLIGKFTETAPDKQVQNCIESRDGGHLGLSVTFLKQEVQADALRTGGVSGHSMAPGPSGVVAGVGDSILLQREFLDLGDEAIEPPFPEMPSLVRPLLQQPMEVLLAHLVDRLPVPARGSDLRLDLMNGSDGVHGVPPSNQHLQPLWWGHGRDSRLPFLESACVLELVQCLSTEDIVTALEAMLLEHKVCLIAKDVSLLTPICEALRLLLFPFAWQHCYIPLLPKELLGYLEAPIPFVAGLDFAHTEDEEVAIALQSVFCFFLDTTDTSSPSPHTAGVHHFSGSTAASAASASVAAAQAPSLQPFSGQVRFPLFGEVDCAPFEHLPQLLRETLVRRLDGQSFEHLRGRSSFSHPPPAVPTTPAAGVAAAESASGMAGAASGDGDLLQPASSPHAPAAGQDNSGDRPIPATPSSESSTSAATAAAATPSSRKARSWKVLSRFVSSGVPKHFRHPLSLHSPLVESLHHPPDTRQPHGKASHPQTRPLAYRYDEDWRNHTEAAQTACLETWCQIVSSFSKFLRPAEAPPASNSNSCSDAEPFDDRIRHDFDRAAFLNAEPFARKPFAKLFSTTQHFDALVQAAGDKAVFGRNSTPLDIIATFAPADGVTDTLAATAWLLSETTDEEPITSGATPHEAQDPTQATTERRTTTRHSHRRPTLMPREVALPKSLQGSLPRRFVFNAFPRLDMTLLLALHPKPAQPQESAIEAVLPITSPQGADPETLSPKLPLSSPAALASSRTSLNMDPAPGNASEPGSQAPVPPLEWTPDTRKRSSTEAATPPSRAATEPRGSRRGSFQIPGRKRHSSASDFFSRRASVSLRPSASASAIGDDRSGLLAWQQTTDVRPLLQAHKQHQEEQQEQRGTRRRSSGSVNAKKLFAPVLPEVHAGILAAAEPAQEEDASAKEVIGHDLDSAVDPAGKEGAGGKGDALTAPHQYRKRKGSLWERSALLASSSPSAPSAAHPGEQVQIVSSLSPARSQAGGGHGGDVGSGSGSSGGGNESTSPAPASAASSSSPVVQVQELLTPTPTALSPPRAEDGDG